MLFRQAMSQNFAIQDARIYVVSFAYEMVKKIQKLKENKNQFQNASGLEKILKFSLHEFIKYALRQNFHTPRAETITDNPFCLEPGEYKFLYAICQEVFSKNEFAALGFKTSERLAGAADVNWIKDNLATKEKIQDKYHDFVQSYANTPTVANAQKECPESDIVESYEAVAAQYQAIDSNTDLKYFREMLFLGIRDKFISISANLGGEVQRAASKVEQDLQFLGDAVGAAASFAPKVGPILKEGVNIATGILKNNAMYNHQAKLAGANEKMKIKTLEPLAEFVAFKITQILSFQITHIVAERSRKDLINAIVQRFICGLANSRSGIDTETAIQEAIANIFRVNEHHGFLGIMQKGIYSRNDSTTAFPSLVIEDLLTKCGVAVPSEAESGFYNCYVGEGIQPEKYGYRLGTDWEANSKHLDSYRVKPSQEVNPHGLTYTGLTDPFSIYKQIKLTKEKEKELLQKKVDTLEEQNAQQRTTISFLEHRNVQNEACLLDLTQRVAALEARRADPLPGSAALSGTFGLFNQVPSQQAAVHQPEESQPELQVTNPTAPPSIMTRL